MCLQAWNAKDVPGARGGVRMSRRGKTGEFRYGAVVYCTGTDATQIMQFDHLERRESWRTLDYLRISAALDMGHGIVYHREL